MDYKELGKRIRAERIKMNMTQEKLAEKIEISESFLGHIERGDRKLSIETLLKIAQEFKVSIDYLLLGFIKQPPEVFIKELAHSIERTDKERRNTLISIIKVLADNSENW